MEQNTNLASAIQEISNDRDIDKATIVRALEEAMVASAQKKYVNYKELTARYEDGDIRLFQYKKVVQKVEDQDNEIALEIAKEVDAESQLDDEMEYEIDKHDYSDVIAQTMRQTLFQKIKEYENQLLEKKYRDKVGQILYGKIEKTTYQKCIVSLQKNAVAILEHKEQIAAERLNIGDPIKALLYEIDTEEERVVLKLSRTHPNFLRELFKLEVPEVDDRTIEIVSVARDPGKRAKVTVRSSNSDVDPVGSCVGRGGERIKAIVNELNGEKIDIIRWTNDIEQQITDAMIPAELNRIEINEENSVANVFVDETNLALAIGKKGQNVKLASRLTKFEINIRTAETAETAETEVDTTDKTEEEETPEIQLFADDTAEKVENTSE